MSGLWTVTLNRLHLVSKFDKSGNKISDTITKIPVTFNDLPYATAKMYEAKAAAGECTITEQIHSVANVRRLTLNRELPEPYAQTGNKRHGEGIAPRHLGSEDISPADDTHEAATTGDFAAAITAEIEAAS